MKSISVFDRNTPELKQSFGLPDIKIKEINENDRSAADLARALVAKYEKTEGGYYRYFGDLKLFLDFQTKDASMRGIFDDYALHGEYEPETSSLINKTIKEGDICLDVGASMGYFAVLMAKKASKVYAVEATTNQIQYLAKNIEANGVKDKVVIHNVAAWDKEGTINVNGNAEGRNGVKATTIDSMLKGPIDFIKMDIDGSEPNALKGMETLVQNSPNLKMVIEYYPKYIEKLGLNPQDMLDFLDKYFTYTRIEGEYSDECYNLYCVRKG